MLVTPLPYGRMCNRLLLSAHFIAHVEKHGGVWRHLAFAPYHRLFEGSEKMVWRGLRYESSKGSLPEGARRSGFPIVVRRAPSNGPEVDMGGEAFLALERRAKVLVCATWPFRDRAALRECGDVVRRFFRPVAKWRDASVEAVAKAREGVATLLGVHVRRTDYSSFAGGAYFFGLDRYGAWMAEAETLFPQPVRFFVVSDEPLPDDAFPGKDWVRGPGSPVADLTSLSMCDAIIGPPSTFSAWASFYGRVPRLELRASEQKIQLEDFAEALP